MTMKTSKEKHCDKTTAKIVRDVEYRDMIRSGGEGNERLTEWAKYKPGQVIHTSNYKG